MAIEDDVAAILTDVNVSKINFHLGPLAVNATQLGVVAKAIQEKKIKTEVKSAGGKLSAAYSPSPISRMTLTSDKIISPFDRSGILHESVHAVVDLSNQKTIGGRNDEVAAYLAECIYLSAMGVGLNRVNADPAGKAIYAAAFAMVKKHNLLKKPGAKLSFDDGKALGDAIHDNPVYSDL
jgi:hypothetical protein